jgi:hypothetical protein
LAVATRSSSGLIRTCDGLGKQPDVSFTLVSSFRIMACQIFSQAVT